MSLRNWSPLRNVDWSPGEAPKQERQGLIGAIRKIALTQGRKGIEEGGAGHLQAGSRLSFVQRESQQPSG